jgi:hypothetical protein
MKTRSAANSTNAKAKYGALAQSYTMRPEVEFATRFVDKREIATNS